MFFSKSQVSSQFYDLKPSDEFKSVEIISKKLFEHIKEVDASFSHQF